MSLTARIVHDQTHINELEGQLDQIRHEHGLRGDELDQVTQEREAMRGTLDQSIKEREAFRTSLDQALREKLVEEAMESASTTGHDLLTELADLYEVMDALMKINHIDYAQVRTIQEQRRAELGGFEQRILLLRTLERE